MGKWVRCVIVCMMVAGVLPVTQSSAQAQPTPGHDHWVSTWASAPLVPSTIIENEQLTIGSEGTTLREIVRLSLGGDTFRVRFTNVFGTSPLTIGNASIAETLKGAAVKLGSAQPLRFHGQSSVTLPPGTLVISDPVHLALAPLASATVSLYLPGLPGTLTEHQLASATSYQVAGNHVADADLQQPIKETSWEYLNGIDVLTAAENGSIVTVGDSITDGAFSTIDGNKRWPDALAERLQASADFRHLAVVNEGISGNRVLREGAGPSALARLDRDVLAQDGVKYLIILEGINDIGHMKVDPSQPASAEELIAAFNQIITRAHAHGIAVIGATITPYRGAAYFSEQGEAIRQAVNQWIRTSGAYDGVVDMDAAVRDPAHPDTMLADDNHGDHLHPNDAGYKVMGQAIDLKLFTLQPNQP